MISLWTAIFLCGLVIVLFIICLPCIGLFFGSYGSDESEWVVYTNHSPATRFIFEFAGDIMFRLIMSPRDRAIRAKKRADRDAKEKKEKTM